VITQVTVRLVPRPEATETLLAAFPSVRSAAEAVSDIIAAGLIPAALEMMDRIVIEACERFMGLGFPRGAEALLLAEVDGGREEVDEALAQVRAIIVRNGATEVRVAANERERAELWRARKGAFAALATVHPDYYTIDGHHPASPPARRARPGARDGEGSGLLVGNVFHAGDGNIHPCIFYDAAVPGEPGEERGLGGRILELCIDVAAPSPGSTAWGSRSCARCASSSARRDRRVPRREARVRSRGILNPGKAVPTLNRCSEWGGMHIREGRMPRADIPRF
jgi:glycolate oxidase